MQTQYRSRLRPCSAAHPARACRVHLTIIPRLMRGNLFGNRGNPVLPLCAFRRNPIWQSLRDCRKNPRHARGFLHKPTKNCARRARFIVGRIDRKRAFDRNQPCFCLCFGFWQITITLPLRRMILHFSQIGFTDGLTFMTFYLHQCVGNRSVPLLVGWDTGKPATTGARVTYAPPPAFITGTRRQA